MGDEQYPESLKRYYVVNPPMLFSVVYKLMSPFVDARTLAKVPSFPPPNTLNADGFIQSFCLHVQLNREFEGQRTRTFEEGSDC